MYHPLWPSPLSFAVKCYHLWHSTVPCFYQVWSSCGLSFWNYGTFPASTLWGLVTLTSDCLLPVTHDISPSTLGFLEILSSSSSWVELDASTGGTDRLTDRRMDGVQCIMWLLLEGLHNKSRYLTLPMRGMYGFLLGRISSIPTMLSNSQISTNETAHMVHQ